MAGGTAAIPAGTVTFLLTDIEGSTRRWTQHPAAMRAALARHDALLHEGIAAHGGVVLTERGEGDSFFALFARASDALAAACALQRTLAAEPWPEAVAPIRVRMALHTGESGLAEGWDHRGAAVNRCARLRAIAHGGQVLLSGATYELVRDDLPPQVGLCDLGEHRLKDLTRVERIFQVLHPDLPADFPPLRTLDRPRHNLPVQPTALIGREREISAVRERLLDPLTRLLTLTGPGGTGKTRLAVQVAAEVLEAFPDGVSYVNLAPITDWALVLPTITQTLGVTEVGSQPLRETLHASLQDKRLLLVLDNFEQVLDAAPVVANLLAASPQLRVLATSRAALHVYGEREYAVGPLALPATAPLPPLETLTQYEAVRLFIARARDVKPNFAVTNATAPAVAEICVRLDGLPLAIELAAARVKLLGPHALLARLRSRLKVLTRGARDLPARQQTLCATIDWSYRLLTPVEQTLFARLAVFVGGCTLEAAEAVCNPDGNLDVLEGVESLVAKSLLRQEERESAEGKTRFVMLETIQEYALDRLETSTEADALRRVQAAWYLALAEDGESTLKGPEQGLWLERLEQEHDNLRAALRWAWDSGEAELGLRLAGALARFWEMHGHLSEGRSWLEGLLALPRDAGASPGQGHVWAKALHAAGALAYKQDDYGRATALQEESLALYRDLGVRAGIALCLNGLANVAMEQGCYERAAALHQESLAIKRALGDSFGIATSLNNLGLVAQFLGEYQRAQVLLEECLSLKRTLGDTWGTALALRNLGLVARGLQEYARAVALFEESVALWRDVGDAWGVATVLSDWGDVARDQGDDRRAAALYAESLALYRQVDNKIGLAWCLEGMAGVACALGQPERTARLCAAAAALREAIGAPLAAADHAGHDHVVATASALLGDDAFAVSWAAGRGLALEQAIAEALEVASP